MNPTVLASLPRRAYVRIDHVAPFRGDRLVLTASDEAGAFFPSKLRDRVVRRLLDEGTATLAQVEQAWMRWQQVRQHGDDAEGRSAPLWRELALDPGVEDALVYETAAKVYAFDAVSFTILGSLVLIERLDRSLGAAGWDRLIENRVMPVVESGLQPGEAPRLAFATPDPTNPAIRRLVATLNVGAYALRYAPAQAIDALVAEAFPGRQHGSLPTDRVHTPLQKVPMSHPLPKAA